ncbi:hypothetical protein, partial [Frankia sp. R82]|uniref:hypothetical protein n=1 Tax=Frankia sp. R82 TaxID=2950553 RepID=UPI002042D712
QPGQPGQPGQGVPGTGAAGPGTPGLGLAGAAGTGVLPAYGSAAQFGHWALTGEQTLTGAQTPADEQHRAGEQTPIGEQPWTAGPKAPGGLASTGGLGTTAGPVAPGGLGAAGGLSSDAGSTGPVGRADPRGPGPWNTDSEQTGEIRRPIDQTGEIRRPGSTAMHTGATPLRSAGVAHWDDELDDEFDPAPHGQDDTGGRSGWAPSRGRLDPRAPQVTRGGAAATGLPARVSAAVREARRRPVVLIVATVVLVFLGLGAVGYLALSGGDSAGGPSTGATAAGHGQYDKDVRNAYLGSCLDVSNGNESYCTCTLDKLEATYTQEEYRRFSASVQSESSQRIVREIYAACRDKR